MTTRQQLDEEMEKIKTRCDILVDLFKNGRITFNELQSTKNILLHNMQDSIIRIVTAALEESKINTKPKQWYSKQIRQQVIYGLEDASKYQVTKIESILNSLQE